MNTITAAIGNNACTMPDQQGKKVATMTGPMGITLEVIQWTAGNLKLEAENLKPLTWDERY